MSESSTLYFGLRAPQGADHCPLIAIAPSPDTAAIAEAGRGCSHLIASSQTVLELLAPYADSLRHQLVLAVGAKTALAAQKLGFSAKAASLETAEGLVELIAHEASSATFFYPHSALSRPVVTAYLHESRRLFFEKILYTTKTLRPAVLPDLSLYTELVFTSPSCLTAFKEIFGDLPTWCTARYIGPITEAASFPCFSQPGGIRSDSIEKVC